jgi:hypothetical protein
VTTEPTGRIRRDREQQGEEEHALHCWRRGRSILETVRTKSRTGECA